MATNEVFRHSAHVSLPVPEGTKSGDPVKVGALNGVAQTNRGEGGNIAENASVWFAGAHRFPVTGAVANVGDPIYIEGGKLAAAGTTVFGAALETQAGDGVIAVKIIQTGAAAAVAGA